jgi:hypothetical protein
MGAKKCSASEHNYQQVDDAESRLDAEDGTTNIMRAFYCTKCGDVIRRLVATWPKRKSGKYKTPDEF